MQDESNKDTQKSLIASQYIGADTVEKSGKLLQQGANKLSMLYDKAKEEILNPDTKELQRIATLDDSSATKSSSSPPLSNHHFVPTGQRNKTNTKYVSPHDRLIQGKLSESTNPNPLSFDHASHRIPFDSCVIQSGMQVVKENPFERKIQTRSSLKDTGPSASNDVHEAMNKSSNTIYTRIQRDPIQSSIDTLPYDQDGTNGTAIQHERSEASTHNALLKQSNLTYSNYPDHTDRNNDIYYSKKMNDILEDTSNPVYQRSDSFHNAVDQDGLIYSSFQKSQNKEYEKNQALRSSEKVTMASPSTSSSDPRYSNKNNNKSRSEYKNTRSEENALIMGITDDTVHTDHLFEETSTNEEQGLSSRIQTLIKDKVTVENGIKIISNTGKATEAIGRHGKKITSASRRIQTALDDDGTSFKFFEKEIKRKVGKTAAKRVNRGIANVSLKVINHRFSKKLLVLTKDFLKNMIKKVILFLSCQMVSYVPIALIFALLITTMTVFGGGDSSIVARYESWMQSVQTSYDQQIVAWRQENPNGIVVGVRGGRGDIDWKVPLAIMQGLYSGLALDDTELALLGDFQSAGLFEQHEEIVDRITIKDFDGNDKVIEMKYLVITNPGYQAYIDWIDANYDKINRFKIAKGLSESSSFSNEEKESIKMLYTSETFFDSFNEEYQDHTTSTGSNESETDYASPEYNAWNPFTASGYKGQCTWYVYGRALKVTGKRMPTGNAVMWLQNARAMGYATGSIPSKNAIAVLAGNNFGHVAFVEAWDGENITISEGNYNNPMAGTNQMVEYARAHATELIHEETYTLSEYSSASASIGLRIVGYIYTE